MMLVPLKTLMMSTLNVRATVLLDPVEQWLFQPEGYHLVVFVESDVDRFQGDYGRHSDLDTKG